MAATWLLATLGGIPLVACAARPSIPVTATLVALTGMCCAYQLLAATTYVRATPREIRAAAIGLASSLVVASQGIGTIGFGLLADHIGAAAAIAIAGAAAAAGGLLFRKGLRYEMVDPEAGSVPA
jgi:hypothetical protein